MSNISFFTKTSNGTRPLVVNAIESVITELRKEKPVTINGTSYEYLQLVIRNGEVSIFLSENK